MGTNYFNIDPHNYVNTKCDYLYDFMSGHSIDTQ